MQKKWIIEQPNIDNNYEQVDLTPPLKKILLSRGITDITQMEKFFRGSLADLYDPFRIKSMARAVNRLQEAVEKRENIIIYGDYDVDGITATALLNNFFRDNYGLKVDYYLPDRIEEGYGLNRSAVRKITGENYDLLLTVDCGITACDEVEYACQAGLDVIITDHHQPGGTLPPALAILNPHRPEDDYPFSRLAGVGVVCKLCQALGGSWRDYLDLVALGSIADIVSLRDENRILVKEGLRKLRATDNPGLRQLLKKLGLEGKQLTAGQVGYILAPPLNAAGRIDDPRLAISLLTETGSERIEEMAGRLVALNRKRQQKEEKIYREAVEMVESGKVSPVKRCIVLASEDWHPGVIGIVASRLVEKYYLPAVLIALEDREGRGSCRSISNLNIYRALCNCEGLFTEFGGHAMAAGFSINRDRIDDLREKLSLYLEENYKEQIFIPRVKLDAVVSPDRINRELYKEVSKMRPFGMGNPEPRFLLNNVKLQECYRVGKENDHLKILLPDGVEGIGFGLGSKEEKITAEKNVDLACTLSLNNWRGKEEIQLKIKEINIRHRSASFPLEFISGDWRVYDKRGCTEKVKYLRNLLSRGGKIGVYLNSKRECRRYISLLPDGRANFYDDNCAVEADGGIYFFTRTELQPPPEFTDLVLISLPFSSRDMSKMVNYLEEVKCIHLLYGREEYYGARKAIKKRLPTGKFLHWLYGQIKKGCYESAAAGNNRSLIERSLTIFSELNLIERREDRVNLLSGPEERLDLSKSIRYNEITDIIEDFNDFSKLAYAGNLFKLITVLKNKAGGI